MEFRLTTGPANRFVASLLLTLSGCFLVQTSALAQLPSLTGAAKSADASRPALIDTLSNRSQLGNIIPPSFPAQYVRSRMSLNRVYQPLNRIPGICADSNGRPQPWAIQFHDDAGHSIIDSSGTRYLQFLLVTCGTSDAPNRPDVGHTAQTWYRVSNDSGSTFSPFKQVIVRGFTQRNPLTGVFVGKNGYQFPGNSLVIPSNKGRDVLMPLEIIPPLNRYKQPVNRGLRYAVPSYSAVRVLRGHWRRDGSDLDWEVGAVAEVPAAGQYSSTRGLDETAIVEIPSKERCVIVSRGSNQNGGFDRGDASIESHYWLFESRDGCRTWNGPGTVLGWDDGSKYFAPAAPPFLFEGQDNRVIFMGAQSDANANGNMPRSRIVAAELDLSRLKLRKDTAVIVDQKYGLDSQLVDLIYSNFYYPQTAGDIFYYTYRLDYGRPCPDGTQSCYPHNWHLLNPIANANAGFELSIDAAASNQVNWPEVPGARSFVIYTRNLRPQGFWELQGSVQSPAAGYLLKSPLDGVPGDSEVAVIIFATDQNGMLTSSNQITVHVH